MKLPGALSKTAGGAWLVVAFAAVHPIRRTLAVVVAVALLASGCGRGTEDSSVTTIGLLSAALAESAEASSYRESLSLAVKFKIAGVELSSGLDKGSPAFVCDVSPEREHCRVDLSTLLESLFGFSLDDWDDLEIEMWFDQERIVIDTRALQPLADAEPDADLGSMAPGVFFVDLAALEADGNELMHAVAGSSTPDLSEMAVNLPAALTAIEQTSDDPPVFVGTTTSARLMEALGRDVEAVARCAAATLAATFPADLDELTDLFIQVFETNTAEVVIELDGRGLLSILWTEEDISGIFGPLVESESFSIELSEQERREALEIFGSAELVLANRIAYEPDADIDVPLPPSTAEDRTQEWHEHLPECS